MEAEQQERLKLIVRNLKSLVEVLESEVYSDAVSYTHLRAPRDLSTSRMPSSA